jgi:hypothetical protein
MTFNRNVKTSKQACPVTQSFLLFNLKNLKLRLYCRDVVLNINYNETFVIKLVLRRKF